MGGRFWVSGQNTAARALAHHGGLGVGSVVFDEATRAEGVRDSARGRAKDLRKGSSKTHLFNPDAGASLQFSSPASPPSPAGAGQKYSPPWEGLSRGFRRAQTLAHPKKPLPRTEPRPSSHRERRGDAPDLHARVHRGAHRRLAHPPPKTAGFSKSGWLRARARTAQVRKPRAAPVPP